MASIQQRIQRPAADVGKICAWIYGKGGAGKTTLYETMPGKGLVLDTGLTEGGTMVLSHTDNIDILTVNSWNEFEEILAYLAGQDKYGWCGLDSTTGAQVYARQKAIQERPLDTDPAIVSQQEWGKVGQLMENLILRLRKLDMHVICTAQERTREGETQPNASPASLQAMIPPMYLIGRLYTMEVDNGQGQMMTERRLRVGPHDNYVTKVRALRGRNIPSIIRNPNLGHIFGYLLGASVPPPQEVVVSTGFVVGQEG